MKYSVLAASLLLLAGSAAASSHTENWEPGLVKAGSPLYGVEIAVDNVLVTAGISSPGDVAFERASEAATAHERGNDPAVNQALDHLSNVSEKASSEDSRRLNQSISVLESIRDTVPDEAEEGVSTALDSITEARDRVQQPPMCIPEPPMCGGENRSQ